MDPVYETHFVPLLQEIRPNLENAQIFQPPNAADNVSKYLSSHTLCLYQYAVVLLAYSKSVILSISLGWRLIHLLKLWTKCPQTADG
jgi:hypothetical protein